MLVKFFSVRPMISAAATWISLYLTKDRLLVSDWMYLNFNRQNEVVKITLQTFGIAALTKAGAA